MKVLDTKTGETFEVLEDLDEWCENYENPQDLILERGGLNGKS